jgi:dihydropyrimidinase
MPELPARGLHVFPGLIDAHVHFGLSGEKETQYATETRHAAHGGFTTLMGYFLNNEAYTDVFRREQEHARSRAHIDYAFHFSTANELHIKELQSYVTDYGVTSFKYFMNFKGEEGRYLGLDGTDDGYLYDLLKEAARIGKGEHRVTIVCHTENIEIVNRIRRRMQAEGRNTLKDWSASKPAFTEAESCVRAMYFAEHLGAQIYVPHLSTRMALDEVRRWRKRYPHVLVETCPHYLDARRELDARLARQGQSAVPQPGRRQRAVGGARRRLDPGRRLGPRAAQACGQGQGAVAGFAGLSRESRRSCRCCCRRVTTRAGFRSSASARC